MNTWINPNPYGSPPVVNTGEITVRHGADLREKMGDSPTDRLARSIDRLAAAIEKLAGN